MSNCAEILKQKLLQSLALPWQDLLPNSRVEAILAEEQITYRNNVYSPVVTLWAMIGQALDPDKSLSNAVKRLITWLSAAGANSPSSDTGAYSKARKRLPEKLLEQLVPEVGAAMVRSAVRLSTGQKARGARPSSHLAQTQDAP